MVSKTAPQPKTYRGWSIYYDPPPIPGHEFDWHAIGPNYDADWQGEETGYVDNGQKVFAATYDGLLDEIDNWFEDNGPLGLGA